MKLFLAFSMFFLVLSFLSGCSKLSDTTNTTSKNDLKVNRILYEKKEEEIIAEYTSPIKNADDGRQTNMTIACNELNGTIVQPGETFSFCDTLGPATPEKGYKKAEVFTTTGKSTTDYGGGKCQVSSTLYNAVLKIPTLVVTERQPHTKKVLYVPEGKDACIAYGGADFKFRNDSNFIIKIYAVNNLDGINIKLAKY